MTNAELLYKLAGLMYQYDQQQDKGYDLAPIHEVYEEVCTWWSGLEEYPHNPKEQGHDRPD